MSKRLQKNIALVCAICLLCALLSGYVAIDCDVPLDEPEVIYNKVPILIDGVLQSSGYVIDGVTYIPIRSFCGALNLGIVVSWDPETSVMTGIADDCVLKAVQDEEYITVNDRCFYMESGVVNYQDKLLVSVRVACSAFNIDVEWDPETGETNLITDQMQICENGSSFYNENDLYWLSRIISAEAKDQSMIGKIGVGNVVLNRVKSEAFPDSVYDVIFDNAYGVQFTPVKIGTIYDEPDEEAIAAAKLCLEGCNLMGNSLYFVNPAIGSTNWFMENHEFVASVGDHDFYA